MSVPQNPLRLVDERGFQSARKQRDQWRMSDAIHGDCEGEPG
jgi:hypothetical protein